MLQGSSKQVEANVSNLLVDKIVLQAIELIFKWLSWVHLQVYPEYEELEEPYKKAFNTLWCLLEDSGWLLKQPGAEVLEV